MKYGHFQGNLGRDWEIKSIPSGAKVYENTLAVRSGKDGKQTMWVKLTQWNEKAGDVLKQYTSKGSKLVVRGEIEIRAWKDNAGEPKAELACRIDGFDLIDSQKQAEKQTIKSEPTPEDDIPF